jgi:lipoate-protein ligase A
MKWISLQSIPIQEQLRIEEKLLKTTKFDLCIVNHGSPKTIVLGLSNKLEDWVEQEKASQDLIPIHRRFSGGGSVVVDESTLFITFIFSKDSISIPAFPEPIINWVGSLYTNAWNLKDFQVRENDYCIGDLKCGGNAQYLQKDRWLHHTSFLWDYKTENMNYLKFPPKTPSYRKERKHHEFLCKLSPFFPTKQAAIELLKSHLRQSFKLEEMTLPFDF